MKCQEYIRVIPGADCAILLIHGIAGTPDQFQPLLSAIPEHWSIYNMLLDGHGGAAKEFSASSMRQWKEQTESVISNLSKQYKTLLIAGHSMGTLFALRAAAAHPDSVQGLYLLAAPLRVRIRLSAVLNALKVVFDRISPDDKIGNATKQCCGVETDRRLWVYLGWLPRFWELLSEIRATRTFAKDVSVPCRIFLSRNDELVSLSSAAWFPSHAEVRILEKSGHYYYDTDDCTLLRDALHSFCMKLQIR